jgi:hypothetical protein
MRFSFDRSLNAVFPFSRLSQLLFGSGRRSDVFGHGD